MYLPILIWFVSICLWSSLSSFSLFKTLFVSQSGCKSKTLFLTAKLFLSLFWNLFFLRLSSVIKTFSSVTFIELLLALLKCISLSKRVQIYKLFLPPQGFYSIKFLFVFSSVILWGLEGNVFLFALGAIVLIRGFCYRKKRNAPDSSGTLQVMDIMNNALQWLLPFREETFARLLWIWLAPKRFSG